MLSDSANIGTLLLDISVFAVLQYDLPWSLLEMENFFKPRDY